MPNRYSYQEDIGKMLALLDRLSMETWVSERYGGDNIVKHECEDVSYRLRMLLRLSYFSENHVEVIISFLRLVKVVEVRRPKVSSPVRREFANEAA